MKAFKNLVHAAVLAGWAIAGLLFTVKAVFALSGLVPVLVFWGWFAAFAAATSFVASKLESAPGVLGVHGAALLAMLAMPRELPFALVRVGLDVLSGRPLPW